MKFNFLLFALFFISMGQKISLLGEEYQKAFINKQNGDVLTFTEVTEQQTVFLLKDVFWVGFTDSLLLSEVKFRDVGYGSPDCQGELSRKFLFRNRLYLSPSDNYSIKLKSGETIGLKKKIWELNAWKVIPSLLEYEISLVTIDLVQRSSLDFSDISDPRKVFNVDAPFYSLFDKMRDIHIDTPARSSLYTSIKSSSLNKDSEQRLILLLDQSSQPTTIGRTIKHSKDTDWIYSYEVARIPIICIDIEKHSQRTDKNDWHMESFLDLRNGGFYSYILFEKIKNCPKLLNSRTMALDYLAGVNQCRQSVMAVTLDPKKKVFNTSADIKLSPYLISAIDQKGKMWKPLAPPEDKNTIPDDRLQFILNPYILFGSWCPIWDLEIWPRLGIQLKRNPEAEVYLCGYGTLLQAAETKTVEEEHALIKKCGVKITPMMYQSLELMRKKQQQGN